jgi:hypothetical protein
VSKQWNYQTYSLQKAQSTVIILEEDADTVQETERPQVRVTRVRRLVPELPGSVSKVVRCHFTDVFPREVSRTEIIKRS